MLPLLGYFCFQCKGPELNYIVKDLVLKIILHHNYNDNSTEERHNWNHFQNYFFSC